MDIYSALLCPCSPAAARPSAVGPLSHAPPCPSSARLEMLIQGQTEGRREEGLVGLSAHLQRMRSMVINHYMALVELRHVHRAIDTTNMSRERAGGLVPLLRAPSLLGGASAEGAAGGIASSCGSWYCGRRAMTTKSDTQHGDRRARLLTRMTGLENRASG